LTQSKSLSEAKTRSCSPEGMSLSRNRISMGQIKVFLVAGDGTALLTLHFTDEGIRVQTERDGYPV
jgi:hypothetical protein